MMGFLKPLTDAEKLAKEQRELAKFNTDRAAKKVADAEASRKAPLPHKPHCL
jgi:hypothetical protein